MPLDDLFAEAQRQLSVCNACRYCAGYCPVWPELELRLTLDRGDLAYLASLCHDCQDCFTACMYTAPHEYGINPPKLFAGLREETYARYVWPRRVPGWLAGRRGVAAAFAAAGLLLGLLSYLATGRVLSAGAHPGSPYQLLPYPLLLAVLMAPTLWSAGVLTAAAARYWRDIHGSLTGLARPRVWLAALVQAVQLRHMRGGGDGCDYPGDAPGAARRWYHLLLVYGFGLCTVSTTSAAVEQDFLGIKPPYPYLSAPVLTGTTGGLAMIAGGAGLLALKARSDAGRGTPAMRRADYGFLGALLLLAVSGLLTLAARGSGLFGPVFAVHLTAIVVAFGIAPYTKFVHWIYRLIAIYKNNLDADRPA